MNCAALFRLVFLLQLGIYGSSLSTDPPVITNGGTVDLPAVENATNVSVFCAVTFQGSPVDTRWQFGSGGSQQLIDISQPQFSNFALRNVARFTNLTILSFNRESLHMMVLDCTNGFTGGGGVNLENAFFIPRFIEPPVLRRESAVMTVVENSAFFFNISQSLGYPSDPSQNSQRATLTYQWFLNGVPINTDTSINPNVSDYPQIMFSSVMRNQDGNYSMIATTEAGSSTGYFILNVQHGVEAIAGTMDQYCIPVGGNVTLVAFTNITGDPEPQSSWELVGGTLGGDTTSRELTLTSVSAADSGNYTNTLSNTVSGTINQINRTVELRVLSLPTAPRNLAVINLTDDSSTTIILRWQNPSNSGAPPFSSFLVEFVSMSPPFIDVNRTFNAISTDPSYTNTFTVTGLEPITNYTVSVRAASPQLDMSCMEQGVVYSQPSDTVSFMTMAGDPEFVSTNLGNTNGKLVVTWSFKHTGGALLTNMEVTCRSEEEGSGNEIASDMSCGGTDMCGDGMAVIPTGSKNVTAGMNYSCTVTATNELGNKEQQRTNYILATSGVPSVPMITGITVGIQLFTLTVTMFAGHTSLYFKVSVMNEQNSVVTVLSDTQTGVPSGLMSYMIAVPFTQSGRHRFTVSASNPFGKSVLESDLFLEVIMPSSTPTATTGPRGSVIPAPTELPSSISTGVFVGVVVGLIAVILILIVLLATVLLIVTRKMKQSEPDKVQSVRNESYGVLGGGAIELKDNAAYSTVSTPHSQSIAMTVKGDSVYDVPVNT